MKKLIIALVFCLVASATAMGQNKVTRSSVNLRSDSNTVSRVLEVIPQGTAVYVVNSLSNGWSQVVYNYQVGYVASNYLWQGYSSQSSSRTAVRYYTNRNGQRVQSQTYYPSAPRGATARCLE